MRLVEVSGLSKSFKVPSVKRDTLREHVLDRFRRSQWCVLQVLDRVGFEVQRGEILGIMGRNGSGKSTLLKIISGIYQPDAGRVAIEAPITPILELGVGWNPELDAIDNVFLLGTVLGLSLRELNRAMDDILEFAELKPFANMKLQHYSTGMAARLAYAVAFTAVSEILVLDEIFAVGDAGFRARCEDRFRTICASGHTVLIVSHDTETIQKFCTRALLLEGGRVVLEGRPSAVCERYTRLLTGIPGEPVA
jgi:ABC-2 type transport system ATP-binding protein